MKEVTQNDIKYQRRDIETGR